MLHALDARWTMTCDSKLQREHLMYHREKLFSNIGGGNKYYYFYYDGGQYDPCMNFDAKTNANTFVNFVRYIFIHAVFGLCCIATYVL